MTPRIVLVHGLGRDLHDWDAVVQALADVGQCEALDLAGFGTEPPPLDGNYSPGAHARRVAAQLMSGHREPVHLVGNSLGGLVSVLVAAHLPQQVASLTLVAPALPLGGTSAGQLQLAVLGMPGVGGPLIRAGRRQALDRRVQDLLRLTFARPEEVPAEQRTRLRSAIEQRDAVPHGDTALIQTVRGLAGLLWHPGPTRRAIAGLSMPVVALYGRRDRLVPVAQAAALRRLAPQADVSVLPRAGHLIQLEDPDDVVQAVRRQVLRGVTVEDRS